MASFLSESVWSPSHAQCRHGALPNVFEACTRAPLMPDAGMVHCPLCARPAPDYHTLAQHMKDKHGHEPPSRGGAMDVTLDDLLQASRCFEPLPYPGAQLQDCLCVWQSCCRVLVALLHAAGVVMICDADMG